MTPVEHNIVDYVPGRLRGAMAARGLTISNLAQASGVPRRSIENYLTHGHRPGTQNIVALAGALQVSTDYLLGVTDVPQLLYRSDELLFDIIMKHALRAGADNRVAARVAYVVTQGLCRMV